MKVPEKLKEDITDGIDGLCRIVARAKRSGLGKQETGKRELTFELYLKIMKWFLESRKTKCNQTKNR